MNHWKTRFLFQWLLARVHEYEFFSEESHVSSVYTTGSHVSVYTTGSRLFVKMDFI